ncbi:MAG TPA: sigma-70 family RNA polymerase sigma factor [Gemmataceae bacterium]|nr:sigma-70 family RNA polymerase sigma factor [Gemmataceae bacterium]
MADRSIEVLQRYLRRLCEEAVPSEDAVLLNRFVTANDREAFERLIARHGPLVLGTARRLVENTHDAEDVFQAVFLSLVRLAKTIRQGRTLPAWLHKTTCRIAAKVRKNRLSGAKEAPPEPCENSDPGAGLVWQEVRQALDEELQRLPERLRSPLLLCYLSGLSRDEAAKQLGLSLGTLKRRLEEGRKTLRIRLERRGIASVGLALSVLTPEALQATVSKLLLDSSLRLIFSTRAVVPATISVLVVSSSTAMKGFAMKSILALVAATAVGVGIYAGMGQADPPKKAEGKKEQAKPAQEEKIVQRDDPLPAGSTMRLGTSRFRQGAGIASMAVSADGKTAFVCDGGRVFGGTRVFDLVSGRARFALKHDTGEAIALSPDGRTIVTKQELHLHIRDSQTGRELRTFALPKKNPWSAGVVLAFAPDGKAIATISDGKDIHLIDLESGKPIRDFSLENPESDLPSGFRQALGIAFSQDGKLMASGSFDNAKGNYFARLWEVETGKELRRFMHGKRSYGIPSLAFSPDAKTLATRAHDGRLRLFDVDTGKERKAFPPDGGGRNPGCVAFSPDGKTVAAAGDSIRLYDTTTGEERLRLDRKQARCLHFREQGKTLTAAVDGAIYRWDTATGKTLTPTAAGDSIVWQILVSPDGRRIVTCGEGGDAHIWDGANGNHLRSLRVSWQRGMTMSPDGRTLAWFVIDGDVKIHLFDLAADRLVERFPAFKGGDQDLTFTAGGKTLVTVDRREGTVRVWNVEAGKEQTSFQAVPNAEKKQSNRIKQAAVSPDGSMLVVAYNPSQGGVTNLGRIVPPPDVIRLWDMASGKELRQLNWNTNAALDLAFSPDGRLLVNRGAIWDIAAGKPVKALADGLEMAAFSCAGRSLATASYDGTIRIWETATWTEQTHFKSQERTTALAFTPSGQILCGNPDTTVLAWDIRPPRVARSVPLESAWNDLATRESAASFQSEGRFLAAPADAVKLFAEKIKPVEALDPKRIQRLIADLGSDVFAVREAASQALHGLDEQALPYLEATRKRPESLEVRLRVTRILEQRQGVAITSERLRRIRAVAILERIGDGASKKLLKRWAGGPVGALLTREASAALKRLEVVP